MRTPLYDDVIKLNPRMVDFHGWDMPIQFTSIIEEHKWVRSSAGLFDVSHMGNISIEGRDSQEFLSFIFPTDISKQPTGKAVYSAYLNQEANMIDDTIIYKSEEDRFLVIPNAGTIGKIHKWILEGRKTYDVNIANLSDKLSILALQGPSAVDIMNNVLPEANKLDHFTFMNVSDHFKDKDLESSTVVGRTGYTGEDGFEFIVPNKYASALWKEIMKDQKVKPIGLGARDSLRMEKGFLLSGQDFNEDRNPIEAGVSWIINWDHDFIGKKKLLEKKENVKERFRGVISKDKTIPRPGSSLKKGEKDIGTFTSGTFSPSLSKGIGLGFVDSSVELGSEVTIVTRNSTGIGVLKKPRLL